MRVKVTMFIILNILALSFLGVGSLFTSDPPAPFQSFGTGFGPAWLSGVDLTWEGSELRFEIYSKYRSVPWADCRYIISFIYKM